ncbi:hypothetical protein MTO96_010550 [Rhipicephalus appendiculatus]
MRLVTEVDRDSASSATSTAVCRWLPGSIHSAPVPWSLDPMGDDWPTNRAGRREDNDGEGLVNNATACDHAWGHMHHRIGGSPADSKPSDGRPC